MREIVWDTETTGFDPQGGDRLVEIGAIELNKHIPTGRVFHQYINPERDMPDSAYQVHGLSMARKKFPGAQNSLDALCRRYGVDNSNREKHGALLDSELLAEVYLELIGGRQPDFALSVVQTQATNADGSTWTPSKRPNPLPEKLTEAERAAHSEFIAKLGDDSVWNKLT